MKVICIDSKLNSSSHRFYKMSSLIEGNIYNVLEVVLAEDAYGNDAPSYYLQGFPFPHAFDQNRFIPLSEIDEMELVNKEKLVNS